MFRFVFWLTRRGRSKRRSPVAANDLAPRATAELVTVRLADGRLVEGERSAGQAAAGPARGTRAPNPEPALAAPPGGPRRRRWLAWVPRWLRWTAVIVIVAAVFRRAATWAVLAALSAALHLFGVNVHLPHVTFGWPWSPSTSSSTLVGPLVLQKIEGIDSPALGTTTFNFLFTHTVSHPMGPLPCWYSGTFYAVGRASATVDLNPGAAWWKPSAGHYVLRVLSQPSGSTPGQVSVTMALPMPRLPQSVHDVSVDNTLSKPVSSDHSWTYPGVGCGVLIKPQFSQSVLYAQAQDEAFRQATTVKGVTQPLIAAAEKEAATIIGGNFVTPTLNALHYKVSQFTLRWVPAGATG